MENTDNNQLIEEKLQAEEEKLLAAARKRIERGRNARRAKIAKRIQKLAASSNTKAAQRAKAKEIVANSGFKTATQLLKAILPVLPPFLAEAIGNTKGHRGRGNGLKPEDRARIYQLRQEKVPASKIAKEYRISVNTVYIISRNVAKG